MVKIVGPETVVIAHLRYPMWFPDGLTLYKVATASGRYFATQAPLLRSVEGQPITLDEELWAGSVVRLALNTLGLIAAVQIVSQSYYDPFAEAASTASTAPDT